MQEFFRIEALLRCNTVINIYQTEGSVTERVLFNIMRKFEFDLKHALNRAHARYLEPWNWREDEERPIRASRGLKIRSFPELSDSYMVGILETIVDVQRGTSERKRAW